LLSAKTLVIFRCVFQRYGILGVENDRGVGAGGRRAGVLLLLLSVPGAPSKGEKLPVENSYTLPKVRC
jgi:hypothetical protein